MISEVLILRKQSLHQIPLKKKQQDQGHSLVTVGVQTGEVVVYHQDTGDQATLQLKEAVDHHLVVLYGRDLIHQESPAVLQVEKEEVDLLAGKEADLLVVIEAVNQYPLPLVSEVVLDHLKLISTLSTNLFKF